MGPNHGQAPSLPSELRGLVHHIHLNRAGWAGLVLERAALALLVDTDGALSGEEIRSAVESRFLLHPSTADLRAHLGSLVRGGLVVLENARYAATSAGRRVVAEGHAEADATENAVVHSFGALLAKYGIGLDAPSLWTDFAANFLAPLVRELGTRTLELLSGGSELVRTAPTFQAFIRKYPDHLHLELQNAILDFFDPSHAEVRAYVTSQLNGFLVLEALQLPEENLTRIYELTGAAPKFRIFLDTNLLFSLLDLHDNPSNEAASEILRVAEAIKPRISVEFLALPSTIDEARRRLVYDKDRLAELRLTREMATAALSIELSSIVQRYLQRLTESSTTPPPVEYFDRYIFNFQALVAAKGVATFNQDTANYFSADPRVAADVRERMKQDRSSPRAHKSSTAWTHDVALWHIVKDLRPMGLESPVEAGAWVLTVDFSLIAYDETKRHLSPAEPPVCIVPGTLLQMLQLWLPRTAELEGAILAGLRPFLTRNFDPSSDDAVIAILAALSRYESENLPPEVTASLLMSEALRDRIRGTDNPATQQAYVDEALAEEVRTLTAEVGRLRQQLEAMDKEKAKLEEAVLVGRDQRTRGEKGTKLARQRDEAQSALAREREKNRELREQQAAVEKRLRGLEDLVRQQQELSGTSRRRRRFVVQSIAVAFGLLVVGFLLSWSVSRGFDLPLGKVSAGASLLAIGIWTVVTLALGKREPAVASWGGLGRLERLTALLWAGVILQVGIGLLVAWLLRGE